MRVHIVETAIGQQEFADERDAIAYQAEQPAGSSRWCEVRA